MMNAALKDQVRRSVLYYVDDIIVTSKKKESYISTAKKVEAKQNTCNTLATPDLVVVTPSSSLRS
jgi:ABC-type transport system involved in Fe-S cluster assembly fused permease/ATPase subunit